jgi:hypothetical protein
LRNLLDGQPIPALLENLKHPADGVRHRTRVELSERPTAKVIAATKVWMKQFDAVMNAAIVMGAAGVEKGYIPAGDDVLHHTKLLDGAKEETLEFTLPPPVTTLSSVHSPATASSCAGC